LQVIRIDHRVPQNAMLRVPVLVWTGARPHRSNLKFSGTHGVNDEEFFTCPVSDRACSHEKQQETTIATNFGREGQTRSQVFTVWIGKIHFQGGKILVFIMFKQHFWGTKKFCRSTKVIWGALPPNVPRGYGPGGCHIVERAGLQPNVCFAET